MCLCVPVCLCARAPVCLCDCVPVYGCVSVRNNYKNSLKHSTTKHTHTQQHKPHTHTKKHNNKMWEGSHCLAWCRAPSSTVTWAAPTRLQGRSPSLWAGLPSTVGSRISQSEKGKPTNIMKLSICTIFTCFFDSSQISSFLEIFKFLQSYFSEFAKEKDC